MATSYHATAGFAGRRRSSIKSAGLSHICLEGGRSSVSWTGQRGSSKHHSSVGEASEDSTEASRSCTSVARPSLPLELITAPASEEERNFLYFKSNTYSSEGALLAYNFNAILRRSGVLEFFVNTKDPRRISVALTFIYFKYKVHSCDIAVDLAVALTYLESLDVTQFDFEDDDSFNVVVYFVYLAHVFNGDRTIRLKDWYQEMDRVSLTVPMRTGVRANAYVMFLFRDVRRYRLVPSYNHVKRYIQRLCAAPPEDWGQ